MLDFDTLNALVLALAGSAWVYPVVFALVVIDGFFPPLPSETAVVALGALAVSAGTPHPVWLLAVAAMGAVLGDSTAYLIGRRIGLTRFRWQRRPAVVRMNQRARTTLLARPASLLLTARYIPVGRVAVNMTAGATRFPFRRFVPLAILGGFCWASYSVLIGAVAGAWLKHNPLLGALLAVVAALILGLVIDAGVSRMLRARRRRAPGRPGSADGARDPAGVSEADNADSPGTAAETDAGLVLHREVGEIEPR
jgi:membrane-associated protein